MPISTLRLCSLRMPRHFLVSYHLLPLLPTGTTDNMVYMLPYVWTGKGKSQVFLGFLDIGAHTFSIQLNKVFNLFFVLSGNKLSFHRKKKKTNKNIQSVNISKLPGVFFKPKSIKVGQTLENSSIKWKYCIQWDKPGSWWLDKLYKHVITHPVVKGMALLNSLFKPQGILTLKMLSSTRVGISKEIKFPSSWSEEI